MVKERENKIHEGRKYFVIFAYHLKDRFED